MIILVDQDGVLADFEGHFLKKWMKEETNFGGIPLQMRKTFHIVDQYPKEFRGKVERICRSEGFFRNLPLVDGAREALNTMLENGHDIRICTSPLLENPYCIPEKLQWIEEKLGRKFLERTIITRDKTLVHGTILIDDKPHITGIREPSWVHLIFDQPFNEMTKGIHVNWSNWENQIEKIKENIEFKKCMNDKKCMEEMIKMSMAS